MINNKTIIIVTRHRVFWSKFNKLLRKKYNPKKIIIFSRDELKQSQMMTKFSKIGSKLRFFIGDVRDYSRLNLAMRDVDIVSCSKLLKMYH